MFRILAIAVVSLFTLFANPVTAQETKLSDQDKKFTEKAAMGGMMEVRLGKVASEKASSAEVKEFGARMVRDHSEANEKLKAIAQRQNLSLPKELDAKHNKTIDKLSGLSGNEFDREYMSEMVKDHEKDLELFKKQAQQGQNSELKQFASDTVGTLETHYKLARDINQQLGAKPGASAPKQQKESVQPKK